MKVALVHDFLREWGGAEEVFASLLELFPEAEVFTAVNFPVPQLQAVVARRIVHTTFLQRFPFARQLFPLLIPLLPFAFEQFDFSGFDLVISDTASFAKGIIVPPGTVHVSYIHTPPRFLWGLPSSRQDKTRNPLVRLVLPFINRYLRHWDYLAAQRPDALVANSQETAKRIESFYRRKASIIHPPVRVKALQAELQQPVPTEYVSLRLPPKKFFLVLGRLERYKRIDQVIKVFRRKEWRSYHLVIAGEGSDRDSLERQAYGLLNVHLVGFVPASVRANLLKDALSLINPQREDFGIAMVESLACGTPVVALNQGGATEIITPQTGLLYNSPAPGDLDQALQMFVRKQAQFTRKACQARAQAFTEEQFARAWQERLSAEKLN